MGHDRLEDLLHSIDMRDRVHRLGDAFRQYFTPLAAAVALYTGAPATHPERYDIPVARYEQVRSSYSPEKEFYVHTPSWVKVSKMPAHVMGQGLYGYTFPSTGYAFVRDDLYDNHETGELRESEVRLHEVLHNVYPTASEWEIRSHVRSILGARAVIHSRLG